tara:strand:+ start:2082 stop:2261 length:180 start_codon:yes stop_codon:yes gene_type:complete
MNNNDIPNLMTNDFESNCCSAPIIYNEIESDKDKDRVGLCTACKEWAVVVDTRTKWFEA